jgi:endonuclease/exonuclease/phosphatase family metal-dependent hydrolase
MIEDQAVDLLLLQESYSHFEHLPPDRFPLAQRRSVWKCTENNRWGSAVFSNSGRLKALKILEFAGWVVGAEIRDATWQVGLCDSILAFSVHAPLRNQSYSKQVNKLLDEIRRIAKTRQIIVGGDFNLTVSHWGGSERPASKQDLAVQQRLADEFGLFNCWQAANPDQPLHQTLRWTGNRTIPYHCDGLFVPREWKSRLQSCTVLMGEEWNCLSDHNPVIASFS